MSILTYVEKRCPRCGKKIFEYHVDEPIEVHVWCRHCHDVITLTLTPEGDNT